MKVSLKLAIVIAAVIGLIGIVVVIYFISQPKQQQNTLTTPSRRSDSQLLETITRSTSSYKDSSGKATITVASVDHPSQDWYIVKIKLINDASDNYAKVLIRDPAKDASQMTVVAGPGTSFPSAELRSKGVPVTIINELNGV